MISKQLVIVAALAGFTTSVHAQWTVTNLHPPGLSSGWQSEALAISGGQQVGLVFGGSGVGRAILWSGSAASWIDLSPPGSSWSRAVAVSGGQQVGSATIGNTRAGLWNGTAASWVDLHPTATTGTINAYSGAIATSGGQQVGFVAIRKAGAPGISGVPHASLWSGSAESWVDLHPAGADASAAYGISGGQQAGLVALGGVVRASLWSGTAESWVDLNPTNSTWSRAEAISDGQQAGWVVVDDVTRASLWSGSAESWVDLNPESSTLSRAYATNGEHQAGYVEVAGVFRASLWSGTAASWIDLHAFLPVEFSSSQARGISNDGVTLSVVGFGFNSVTQREEALLWTMPLPSACYADCDENGTLDTFDYICFGNAYVANEPYADCDGDGDFDIFDYICFGNAYAAGCP
ncbi:MAG: hypothetical protein H6815_12700 [Phycisphaeraceae bacterium]|nr:hypothetical protein [Phycisphaerales bacterium]MCB9861301.1 hypothetical protein [Phycisphaeraceae bacterium]